MNKRIPATICMALAMVAAQVPLAPSAQALCTPQQWQANPELCQQIFQNEGPGYPNNSTSSPASADMRFLQEVIALGKQHGFTIGHQGGMFSDPFGMGEDAATINLGHNICDMIGLQNMTPKRIDETIWWALTPDQGKYVTKAAIRNICPWFMRLEYW